MKNSNTKRSNVTTGDDLLTSAVAENKNIYPESKINHFVNKFLIETQSIEAKLAKENIKDY